MAFELIDEIIILFFFFGLYTPFVAKTTSFKMTRLLELFRDKWSLCMTTHYKYLISK